MKKIILFVGIAVCILTACNEKNAFTLTGSFANNEQDGKLVYLQAMDFYISTYNAIDSARVENGKFVFKGIAKELPEVQFIGLDLSSIMSNPFIVEQGKIKMNFDSELKSTVKGTELNDRLQLFEKEKDDIFEKIIAVNNELEEIKKAGILTSKQFWEFDKSKMQQWETFQNTIYNFIKSIITTPAGQFFLKHNGLYLTDSQYSELLSLTNPEYNELEIQPLEKAIKRRINTAAGKKFTDVKGFDFDGKEIKLSDYAGKGKIVLINFWSSKCDQCIQDMPDLITLYQNYKGKGFEIVGISLDTDKEIWKKSTEDLKIPWPQFSNLKGSDEDCSTTYGIGINSIPHTVLIDKDGIIIERGLRMSGDKLKFMLEDLLGNK